MSRTLRAPASRRSSWRRRPRRTSRDQMRRTVLADRGQPDHRLPFRGTGPVVRRRDRRWCPCQRGWPAGRAASADEGRTRIWTSRRGSRTYPLPPSRPPRPPSRSPRIPRRAACRAHSCRAARSPARRLAEAAIGHVPVRGQHVDDLGQERRQHREQRGDVDPASLQTSAGPRPARGRRRAGRRRSTGWRRSRSHRRDLIAEAGFVQGLGDEAVQSAFRLDRGREPGEPATAPPAVAGAARVHRARRAGCRGRLIMDRLRSAVRSRAGVADGTPRRSVDQSASGSSQVHSRSRRSSRRPVRSRWIGVTATRRLTTAWKSVPGTASPDGGWPPIQK